MRESISGKWNRWGWVPRTFVMWKVWEKKKKTEEEGITEANR